MFEKLFDFIFSLSVAMVSFSVLEQVTRNFSANLSGVLL